MLELPFLTFDGKEIYPTILEKITRLSYSLTINHCFLDGNKRIGAFILIFLLEDNGFKIEFDDEELIKTFLEIAQNRMNYEEFLKYIKDKIAK